LPGPSGVAAGLRCGCPTKDPLERKLRFHFRQPVSDLDIRNTEILVREHACVSRLTNDPVLEAEIQVVVVLVVE